MAEGYKHVKQLRCKLPFIRSGVRPETSFCIFIARERYSDCLHYVHRMLI